MKRFSTTQKWMLIIIAVAFALLSIPFVLYRHNKTAKSMARAAHTDSLLKVNGAYWTPPAISDIADSGQKKQVEYGRELIAHTAKYLGPNGTVSKISNGMNCQNCHLQAGTAVF